MSVASSPSERLAAIVDEKPIYLSQHDHAALALIQLVDYDNWALSECTSLVPFLHGIHLRVDALVQQYGFYKVDFRSGEFTVAANISGDAKPHVTELLLQFACDLLLGLSGLEHPKGKALRTRIALATGTLKSAILGKSALKYSVHGRPEVIARYLLHTYGCDGSVVASKRFVESLSRGNVLWSLLPFVETASPAINERAYLFEDDQTEASSLKSQSRPVDQPFIWKLLRFVPSLSFPDWEMERHFRLFQADRFSSFDILYMSLSLSMILATLLRSGQDTGATTPWSHMILSFLGVAVPLGFVAGWGGSYRKHRLRIISVFRVMKLVTVAVFGFRQRTTNMIPLLLNYAILHGMHAIGTQLVLPMHLTFQVLSVMLIAVKSVSLCRYDPELEGCHPITAALILFTITLLVPSFIAYRIEKQQRCVYSHGSSGVTSKRA